ncbi:carbohydrate ABC transporter permease [Vallitalea okinawensis]|uniref:carbohydrate ABC transporter permease n=1 Tax=Vallitalea okinawensis TaxID=2078660 RepID=UPI000CFDE354|nr:sugar ABC transporter permease [Vallitalea okinawensis]
MMKKKKLSIAEKEALTGVLFIFPYALGFLIFHALPFILSFVISMTDLRFISKISEVRFIFFDNFLEMFNDPYFWEAFSKSVQYTVIYVPLIMLLSLMLALMVNKKIYAKNAIKTMIFMPYISNIVAIAIVWGLLLDPIEGPINNLLMTLGMTNPPMWLMGAKTALPTVVIIAVWQGMGLQFITYLAALQGVPRELIEASQIDGANRWKSFIHVTLPMISPTTFFLTITSIISSLKNFSVVHALTEGGPGTSTRVLALNIVRETFASYRMGYASAQAIFVFVFILIITVIQWKGQRRFVSY